MTKAANVILVPIDFEAASEKALALAKDLAGRIGGEIVLVHIYQLPVYTYPGLEPTLMPGFHTEVASAAQKALDNYAEQHGGFRTILREGDPPLEILEVAAQVEAKMIVMGTHGRSGLAHFFIGSVAEHVVRKSTVPVLTVRAG